MAAKLFNILIQIIELYKYVLIVWVFGSWFPQFTVTKFFRFIDNIIYPYAKIFRGLIPPIGGFDFSIIVAVIALGVIQHLLVILAGFLHF